MKSGATNEVSWVARAKMSHLRGLFWEDCFDETPKPARETRALPGTNFNAREQWHRFPDDMPIR